MTIQALKPVGALDPYIPSPTKPWNAQRIRHLYSRIGFGATEAEVQTALAIDPTDLVASIIGQVINIAPTPPFWADWDNDDYASNPDLVFEHKRELRRRWLRETIDDPIRAKLGLFWHNHFVAEEEVYYCNSYMWYYFSQLHKAPLGNFRTNVEDMGKTAAMLVYLNGNQNVAQQPNENYSRELMELFTMGENNGYTQNDVVEVARALTGWRVDMYQCTPPYFQNFYHDNGQKTIFGQTGNFDYDSVHELIFTERADQVSHYICEKIYANFVSRNIDEAVVNEMAITFQSSNWELAPVFEQLLSSDHFFESRYINDLIKSPLENVSTLIRSSGITPDLLEDGWINYILYFNEELGQDLLNPVDVAGWPGHRSWINETTLTLRWGLSGSVIYWYLASSDLIRAQLQLLAIEINGPDETDPNVITENLVAHFLNTNLDSTNFLAAVQYFKGEVPENYFDEGIWNLYYDEVPDQMLSLLYYLTRLPEWQLW